MEYTYLLILLLPSSWSQEVSTPSSLLRPRNFNHHPFDAVEYLKSLRAEPTKQGPVLFPNDAPPPPRPPLIVTSRPLAESIARSELGAKAANTGTNGANNTQQTAHTQINPVSFVPFLARVPDYRPYHPSPTYNSNYNFIPTQVPYAEAVRKNKLQDLEGGSRYNNYEERTALPPIYKVLSDYAQQRVQEFKGSRNYKAPLPDYNENYQTNDINDGQDQNDNYAFSYRVNDKKTGDDFSHSQQSSGSATNGEYRVRLPDGRMQIVSYTADENGYKADVRYDDEEKRENKIDYTNDYSNKYVDRKEYVDRNAYDKSKYENRVNTYVERNTVRNNMNSDVYGNNVITDNFNSDVYRNHVNNNNDVYKNNIDYTDRTIQNVESKPVNEKDEYYYPDVSKEYYTDYSSEYNSNYEPHRSKYNFAKNAHESDTNVDKATVKPSYEELKNLFTKSYVKYDPVELTVPSTTPLPYEGTTERVVVIGTKAPNLYTNIRNSIPNIPSYSTPKVIVATTPRSYLVSTIASLKNKVHLVSKPVLSEAFVNKINKYLTFN